MRVSPLLECHPASEFVHGPVAGMTVALTRRDGRGDDLPFIVDLSVLRKLLLVGQGAAAALAEGALAPPAMLARGTGPDGSWVARLGARQYLVAEGPTGGEAFDQIAEAAPRTTSCIEQEWCEIGLADPLLIAVLGEFSTLTRASIRLDAWVPLLIADIEAVAIRRSDDVCALLCAPADGVALFQLLDEISRELGGIVLGLDDFRRRWLPGPSRT
jgi:hypothetical protein